MGEIIWSNKTIGLHATYEIINNGYAVLQIENSNINAYIPTEVATFGERRMTTQQTLDYFTPKYLQGKNTTITAGFSFGF